MAAEKGVKQQDNITQFVEKQAPQAYTLTKAERGWIAGIRAQSKALDEYLTARQSGINEQVAELSQEIEERLDLPVGAIGSTHLLNFARGTVDLVKKPEPEPEQANDAANTPPPAQAG